MVFGYSAFGISVVGWQVFIDEYSTGGTRFSVAGEERLYVESCEFLVPSAEAKFMAKFAGRHRGARAAKLRGGDAY